MSLKKSGESWMRDGQEQQANEMQALRATQEKQNKYTSYTGFCNVDGHQRACSFCAVAHDDGQLVARWRLAGRVADLPVTDHVASHLPATYTHNAPGQQNPDDGLRLRTPLVS